jgi:hypothetical protein
MKVHPMNIDIPRLEADMRALERRIRIIKQPLRKPWTEPMSAAQAELIDLAAEATALYTLRAWARGRLHRTAPPRALRSSNEALGVGLEWDAKEHNRKLAERVAQRYTSSTTPPLLPVTDRDPPPDHCEWPMR